MRAQNCIIECEPKESFRAELSQEGSVFTLQITCVAPGRLTACKITALHAFSATERVLFNGWQSWTDTYEVPATARLVGLERTPQPVIDHWVVDASGDYRFASYKNHSGVRHGWTYAYFTQRAGQQDNSCLFIAGLDEQEGFTKLSMDADAGQICIEPELPAVLASTDDVACFRFAAIEAPSVGQAFDSWFALMGMKARRAPLLAGYSSWYRRYGEISHEALKEDLSAMELTFSQLKLGEMKPLFQIDDGYCKVGDWEALNMEKFPRGMATMVQSIHRAGFLAGLWMAPFVCERDSALFAQHPDWLLRDAAGNLVKTGSHWSGQYALDTLNPEVRSYVRSCIGEKVKYCGFDLLKLDFLYASCMLPHGGMNRGQLMADAVALLREAAGEETLLVGCGVPLAAAFGTFDYCRVGCDVSRQWDGPLPQRIIDRERVCSHNNVTNTVYRAPLCGRAFINDTDAVYVASLGYGGLNAEQRKLLLDAAAAFGGTLLTSDDMARWREPERALYQKALDAMQVAWAARRSKLGWQ